MLQKVIAAIPQYDDIVDDDDVDDDEVDDIVDDDDVFDDEVDDIVVDDYGDDDEVDKIPNLHLGFCLLVFIPYTVVVVINMGLIMNCLL